jgi:competence protein ComEC
VLAWPEGLADLGRAIAGRLRSWALVEVGPGRLVPWLPVAFGLGIVLYFAAEREPSVWAAVGLAAAATGIAVAARRRPVAFPLTLAFAAIAAGFATATVRQVIVAHPVLTVAAWNVSVAGFVEVREERERSDRIVVQVTRIDGVRRGEKPDRVRVSVRKGTAPPVGSFVEFRARLSPPLEPLRPGGYDFARGLYFQGIGASGFVLGRIRLVDAPAPPGFWLRYAALIERMRDAIDGRIRAVLTGDRGAIASALITGKRDAISTPVNDAMYISSLGHVLSISGYHMAVVCGIVFFTLRALLALIPAFASQRPIRKWAALAAMSAGAFYLLLSGAQVATQRSFIMVAVVLIGVMVDRPAITLRTLTIAAIAVLLLAPESVVHPSFQMSFAATLALVAGYERGVSWMRSRADTPLGARIALWGGRELLALVVVSVLAGLATTLFAAYHFHRLAPYGVLANLLAMPVVSFWVMPAGIAGVIALPFGFDGIFWRLMGEGVGWMIAVAVWVASLPGAVGRIPAFGTSTLVTGAAGLIVLGLLKSPLRLAGVVLLGACILMAVRTPKPDVLVAANGQALAVRLADGRLAMVKTGNDTFALREWLAADGDERAVTDASLGKGITCDRVGCIGRLADGTLIALARAIEAFEEDCRRAAVVASPREAPPQCSALVIDRNVLHRHGAIALYRSGNDFVIVPTKADGHDRPWARAVSQTDDATPTIPGARPRARQTDATPRPADLDAEDQ